MYFATTTNLLNQLGNLANVGYFLVGILVFWGGSKIYKGSAQKETNNSALATIEILQANINAVDKQRAVEKEAADKVIVRLEKQIDDLTERNRSLDDQVKTLSIIPWDRQQTNHAEVMKALGDVSKGVGALVDFLAMQTSSSSTTTSKSSKVVIETK